MAPIKNVLVIGATGMLGRPVTRALVSGGYSVSALVRTRDARLPDGVRAMTGDIFDATAVAKALEGQDAVYLNLGILMTEREKDRLTEREGLQVVLQAAQAARLRRVAALTPLVKEMEGRDGFSWWVFREKQRAEQAILSSGIPYTLFRASSFFENLHGGMRRGNAINLAGKAEHRTWYISGDDYGKMVATALSLPSSENRVYVAQGPEALYARELAQRFIAAYRKEQLKIQAAPLGVLKAVGLFSLGMRNTAMMLDALNRYPESFQAQETWTQLGKPSTTVEDYARITSAT